MAELPQLADGRDDRVRLYSDSRLPHSGLHSLRMWLPVAASQALDVNGPKHDGAAELVNEDETGTILHNPADPAEIRGAIRYWKKRQTKITPPHGHNLCIERNLAETLEVLEIAAREAKENRR